MSSFKNSGPRLYGCYENLVGGQLSDALQDVSGGVAETINVQKFLKDDPTDKDKKLFETLRQAFDHQSLIVAAIAVRCAPQESTVTCRRRPRRRSRRRWTVGSSRAMPTP